MNKNAIGYTRVSSEEQINNYSLENQKDKCVKYCNDNDFNLLKLFKDEGKSATSLNRPALIDLLDYCKKNKDKVDALVIYKIDRLSRSTYDYLEVKRRLASYGITIISVTEPNDGSPTGEFLETLMAAQARLDNAIKSERTKDGMTKRLEAGLPTNLVPVGYKYAPGENEKNMPVPDEPRFTQLQNAGHEYLKGIHTKIQIAEFLNKQGFKTRNNKSASSQFVSHFFSNVFYKGIVHSKVRNKNYIGIHQKMFEEGEWCKIQQISEGTSFTASPKKRNNPDFPLRHFTMCGICGDHITGNWSSGNGGKYAYYRCPKHKPSVNVEVVEREFFDLLQSIKPTEETVERFTVILKAKYDGKYKELISNVSTLEKELQCLETTRKKLVQKNLDGIYDDVLFKEQDNDIKDKMVVKKIQISEAAMDKLDIDTICEFAKHFLENIAQTWKNADLDTKQRLQEMIFPEGVTYHFPGFRTIKLSCLFNVLRELNDPNESLGWSMGIEPITSNSTGWRSNQLS